MDPRPPGVPPLPPEDHRCGECGFDYATVGVQQALSMIREVPGAVRAVVDAVPGQAL